MLFKKQLVFRSRAFIRKGSLEVTFFPFVRPFVREQICEIQFLLQHITVLPAYSHTIDYGDPTPNISMSLPDGL